MNRRDALAALMALPATTRISVADIKPEDVIVVEYPGSMSQETALRLQESFQQVWPGRKVVVLPDGLTLKIAKG